MELYTDGIRNVYEEREIFLINIPTDPLENDKTEVEIEPKNEFEKDMLEGVLWYRKRQYVAAAKHFLALIEKHENEAVLYHYIANTFSYLIGGFEYSLRFFRKALELGDQIEFYLDYANILRAIGEVEMAIHILETARDKYPEYGNPEAMLTYIYKSGEEYERCKEQALSKKNYNFNGEIREWETEHQMFSLK